MAENGFVKPVMLVVEDHRDLAEGLVALFGKQGWRVTMAESVTAARRVLGSGLRPDAMVVDYLMPEMTGAAFLRGCRRDPLLPAIPAVLLTGLDPSEIDRRGLEDVPCLRKPFDVEQLLSVLRRSMDSARPGSSGTTRG
jgi:CheY-like chemotaxis protein